ncbi:MAG: hypothetical protein JWO22_3567 [Frankiales bacterium]|nr:hypothetical protein [Frankiales bacterium]
MLLLVLVVSACSSSSVQHAGPTPSPTPTKAVTKPPVKPAFAVTAVSGAFAFRSADGNLGCDIESAYARCDPEHRDWKLPPQPSDCASGWGHGIELQAGTKGSFFCGSDSVKGGTKVLATGHAFKNGFVQCDAVSASTIHCHGTDDTHGFTISRAKYSLT